MENDEPEEIRDIALATVIHVQLGMWELQQKGLIQTAAQINEPRLRAVLHELSKRGVSPCREREEVLVCLRELRVPKKVRAEIWNMLEEHWQEPDAAGKGQASMESERGASAP